VVDRGGRGGGQRQHLSQKGKMQALLDPCVSPSLSVLALLLLGVLRVAAPFAILYQIIHKHIDKSECS
jgi:hypothetical protein